MRSWTYFSWIGFQLQNHTPLNQPICHKMPNLINLIRKLSLHGSILLSVSSMSLLLSAQSALSNDKTASQNASSVRSQDWNYLCLEQDNCRILQKIAIETDGVLQEVMLVSIGPLLENDADWAIVFQTPLDVLLPAGLNLNIDKGEARNLAYRNCNAQGCWVVSPANKNLIRDFRRGKNGFAAIQLLNGEKISIAFSLSGFSASMDLLEEQYDTGN